MTAKHCSGCGVAFGCGAASGQGCWCAGLPMILPPDADADCLCPACLQQRVQTAIADYLRAHPVQGDDIPAIPARYHTLQPVEGIDYYLEAGRWVFTAWFHRKRGVCCGNACRHCPYDHRNVL